MTAVIQFIGAVTALAGVAALVFAGFAALNFYGPSAVLAATYGVSALLSGCLLFVFGRMADDIAAIRRRYEDSK